MYFIRLIRTLTQYWSMSLLWEKKNERNANDEDTLNRKMGTAFRLFYLLSPQIYCVVAEDFVGSVHVARVYHRQWMSVGDRAPETIKLISPRENRGGAWAVICLTTNLFLAAAKAREGCLLQEMENELLFLGGQQNIIYWHFNVTN